jgi:predicted TIM-barrel fold metal-dependent hydrolase
MTNATPLREPTIPGPDANTRKPRFLMPPGSCDCHAHVFGPQSRYPYAANAAYIPPDATEQDFIRMLTTIGYTRAVIVQASVYGTDHRAMLDAMRSGLFQFAGVAVIPEDISDKELEDMHSAGVRGVRINLASKTPGLGIESVPRLAQRLKPLGWHLQFYLDIDKMPDVEQRLGNLPVDIVLDHFGHVDCSKGVDAPGFQTLLRLLQRDHCWAKLIGPYRVSTQAPLFPDVTPFAHAMLKIAPDRLVWGTDWPHPNMKRMPNDGDLADMLLDWIPDESLRGRVLVDNPARLYGFTEISENA